MKAAVYYNNKDIRVEDVSKPVINDDEILVKTIACGLCGGEAMEWYHIQRAPKVMGHEPAGIIEEVGRHVQGYSVGDRIFVNHHAINVSSHLSIRGHYTKDHEYHRSRLDPGGMCEYFKISADHIRTSIIRLPDSFPFGEATILEPWGCVIGGLKKSNIQPGDTVAVVGCGFMGQGFIHMAHLFGAGKVIACDLSEYRLERALKAGANATINPGKEDPYEALRNLNEGREADVVISTVPSVKVIEQAYNMVYAGGTLHINAPSPVDEIWEFKPNDMYTKEITITTKYSADHTDIYQLFEFIQSGKVDPSLGITHRFGLDGIQEAFELLVKGEESLKSVIYPHGIDKEIRK
ncbi:MAG: zinc-binding dehydrogenase [Sphaerochaetaceae bacterium]|nr:zinc-binding dehydrogenase [Sphaerochaetaceae bacterium]